MTGKIKTSLSPRSEISVRKELMNMKADSLMIEVIGPTTGRAFSGTRPFLGTLKKALKSFVEWIDNVDVDGQPYWA